MTDEWWKRTLESYKIIGFPVLRSHTLSQFSMIALTKSKSVAQKRVCVRLLPPSMDKDTFIEMLASDGFKYGEDYNMQYYVCGTRM